MSISGRNKELVFAISLLLFLYSPSLFLSSYHRLFLSFGTSLWSSGRIRASRGIIFAVLPIQLCVRRKAAFNKSLIKGKQRGVVRSSRVVLVSSAPARERPFSLISLPPPLSSSLTLYLALFSIPFPFPPSSSRRSSSKGLRESRPVGPAEEKREHAKGKRFEKGSQLPRTDGPTKKY